MAGVRTRELWNIMSLNLEDYDIYIYTIFDKDYFIIIMNYFYNCEMGSQNISPGAFIVQP